jgi:murein DD-endopeptidase MepM/ murein hydrolase activator NlpD
MKAFWSAIYRYRWLAILLVLLACLAPQFTISAPGIQETVRSTIRENQSISIQDIPIVGSAQARMSKLVSENIVIAAVEKSVPGEMEEVISSPQQEIISQPPTNQVAPSGSDQLLTAIESSEPVLPATKPLRFTFPEEPPPLTSAWRPPLYPVPWAKAPQDHFYFIRPIAADDINWPLWDYRYGGMFFENVVHTGIDIVTRIGTPVVAAGSGKVIWAGSGLYRGVNDPDDPYGLAIAIQHDFSYHGEALYTIYGHLDRIDVVWGQIVKAGDPLGLSGNTGQVTGPHLHFEVRVGRNGFLSTRNPELWLAPPQGWGLLAGRVMDTGGRLIDGQQVHVQSLSSTLKRSAVSYGLESVNSDPYYQENIVISDLPAGLYEIRIDYAGFAHKQQVEINAGLVSYFTFQGHRKFGPAEPPMAVEEDTPFPP